MTAVLTMQEYRDLYQQYNLLKAEIATLEHQILQCKDEEARALYRADFRDAVSRKEALHQKLIEATTHARTDTKL